MHSHLQERQREIKPKQDLSKPQYNQRQGKATRTKNTNSSGIKGSNKSRVVMDLQSPSSGSKKNNLIKSLAGLKSTNLSHLTPHQLVSLRQNQKSPETIFDQFFSQRVNTSHQITSTTSDRAQNIPLACAESVNYNGLESSKENPHQTLTFDGNQNPESSNLKQMTKQWRSMRTISHPKATRSQFRAFYDIQKQLLDQTNRDGLLHNMQKFRNRTNDSQTVPSKQRQIRIREQPLYPSNQPTASDGTLEVNRFKSNQARAHNARQIHSESKNSRRGKKGMQKSGLFLGQTCPSRNAVISMDTQNIFSESLDSIKSRENKRKNKIGKLDFVALRQNLIDQSGSPKSKTNRDRDSGKARQFSDNKRSFV